MPAIVWHGGSSYRGATVGVCAGLFFGVLAWQDSGMFVAGAIVFIVVGVAPACGWRAAWPDPGRAHVR
jgi:hypothetical protein